MVRESSPGRTTREKRLSSILPSPRPDSSEGARSMIGLSTWSLFGTMRPLRSCKASTKTMACDALILPNPSFWCRFEIVNPYAKAFPQIEFNFIGAYLVPCQSGEAVQKSLLHRGLLNERIG